MTASTKELEAAFRRIVLWPQHNHSMSQMLAYASQHVVRPYCHGLNQALDLAIRASGIVYEAHALYQSFSTGGEVTYDEGYTEEVRARFKGINDSIRLIVPPFYENLQGIMEGLHILDSVKRDTEKEKEDHKKAVETAKNTVLQSTVALARQAALQTVGQMRASAGSPASLALPLLTFAGGTVEELIKHGPEIVGRTGDGRRCAKTIKRTQSAIEDLHTLADHATSFATWWEDMDAKFTQVYQMMEDDLNGADFQLHVKQIADETKQLQDQLTTYAESLTSIQESYAALL